MFKQFRQNWSRELVRPLIHRTFTRLVWGIFAALFLSFLISRAGGRDLRSPLCLAFALIFLVGAWLSRLQMDGLRLPRLDLFRKKLDRKRPARGRGDMIDFVDEEVQSYEELEDAERYLVLCLADLISAVILILASLLLR